MPFRWVVPFSVFSIQCPPIPFKVRKSASSISLRNAIKKYNSLSRHLSTKSLISYLVAGGPAFTMLPTPVHSFQAPLDSLRSSTELVGSALYSVGTRFENLLSTIPFTKSSPAISSTPLVSKGEFLSCLAQKLSLFSLEKDSPAARFYT